MKNKTFFLIVIFVASLLSHSLLVAQSRNEAEGPNETLNNQAAPSLDQNSSPLMMFSEDEKSPTDKTSDHRTTASRGVYPRSTAVADNSSDAARGTASGLAEEGEDEGYLTLDHFRTALASNSTATRFVIVEDEENGISIEPRAAGTSKFALSKNKLENKTIIEALRKLLVTRHGGSSEIVTSFFNEVNSYGDTPLSAESLRNILSRSDAARKPIASKKAAVQKTPPPSVSENDETSVLDDSNVDESLGADIRGHLQTIEKINLAESLFDKSYQAVTDFKKLQKAAMRKKREQKVLASAVESDTEGYMTPGTFLVQDALKEAQLKAARLRFNSSTLLPEDRGFLSPVLHQAPEDKKTVVARKKIAAAEEVLEAAEAAHDVAKKLIKRSGKVELETKKAAYNTAEEAWTDTIVAYEAAIEKANVAKLDPTEIDDLNNSIKIAEENAAYWTECLSKLNSSSSLSTAAAATEPAQSTMENKEKPLPNALATTVEETIIQAQTTAKYRSRLGEIYQLSCEYQKNAVEATSRGDEFEAERWEKAANAAAVAIRNLDKTITYTEKAEKAGNDRKEEEAEWINISLRYQSIFEHWMQISQAYLTGDLAKAERWEEARDAAISASGNLDDAATYIEKAEKASNAGKGEEAVLWRNLAFQKKTISEYYINRGKATLTGNLVEVEQWEEAIAAEERVVCKLEKAAKEAEKR